jgi:hypothetical protein
VTTQERDFTVDEVLKEERTLLADLTRAAAAGKTLDEFLLEERTRLADPTPAAAADEDPPQAELLGLAFSGGGIRSATFNLGVLQALSELKLLKEFGYLSTVSGGGYIGSWLSAWIHRADEANLKREEEEEERTGARPPHTPGITTVQERLSLKDHPHDEPKAVTFLRSYSNYLTPRTGLFSTDTLAAAATYLRNLILNLTILILCLTVVLLVPRMVAWIGQLLQACPNVLLGVAALGLAVAMIVTNLNLASQLPTSKSSRSKPELGPAWKAPAYATRTAVVVWIVLPLALAALALSFWLARRDAPLLAEALLNFEGTTLWRDVRVAGGMTLAIGLFWRCALWIAGVVRETGDRPTWRWRLGALLIGVVIGLVALVAFQEVMLARSAEGAPRLWWATVWGLPGLLGVFALAVVFVIGVSGRQFEEDSREWWSRLGGVLLGVAGGWLVVAGLAVYAPPAVMAAVRGRQGPERRLAPDHHRWRARRYERVHRQVGFPQLARGARPDHAVRLPDRAPGGPRLRHSWGPGRVERPPGPVRRLLPLHRELAHADRAPGALRVQRAPRRLLLLAHRRERVRVPHVLPEPAGPVLPRRQ